QVARDRVDVNLAHGGDLLLRQPAEVKQLDDTRLALAVLGQLLERIIECNEIPRASDRDAVLVEHCRAIPCSALAGAPPPGAIDEDLTHAPGCDREEMRPILELELQTSGEAEIGLVDEIGRSQRLTRPLASQQADGKALQLVVDQRPELVERLVISALAPG